MSVVTAKTLNETGPSPSPDHIILPIKVWLQGGSQNFFSEGKDHKGYAIPKHFLDVSFPVPSLQAATMGRLITHLAETYLSKSREKHKFYVDGGLAVGYVITINNEDWELPGMEEARLAAEDEVIFIYTMHGG